MNALGVYQFLSMTHPPEPPKEDVDIVAREGVDGIAAWLTGIRGHQSLTRTGVDVRDVVHAWDLYQGYCALIGTIVDCAHAGMPMGSRGFRVLVKDIKFPPTIKAIGASSGGLHPPSAGWLEVEWELWSVAN